MPDPYLVLDLVVVIALAILSITVLLKNSKMSLNRSFALFVASISIWIMANYISNDTSNSPTTATFANYFVFLFSYTASIYLLRFVIGLADDTKANHIFNKFHIPLLLIALTGATPLVVTGVALQGGVYAVLFGPLAPLYFITLLVNIFLAIWIVRRNIKRTSGDQRERLKVLSRSMYWTFPVLLLAQAILPSVTGWFGLTNIGILPMLILVYGLYYGVVKHRLFDLRPVILRTLVYGTTLAVISIAYVAATHTLAAKLNRSDDQTINDFLNIILILIIIAAYNPLKNTFKKLTNRIFYQDAYDPQDLFDELNKTLVSSIDVTYLMRECASILQKYLKIQYCLIVLGNSTDGYRLFGTQKSGFKESELVKMNELARPLTSKGIVLTDDLDLKLHDTLHGILQKKDAAALIRLGTYTQKHDNGLGYIIMGLKQSGGSYTHQDIRVLEAATNELIIAIQNALHFEEIQQFNITLQQRINEATRQLRRTNAKLQALDETKDDFISMASHQLRTPLTSVKGYLSMVIEGDAGEINPMQHKMLDQAFLSSQRMVFLIADLLNVSRLKTGKFVIERSKIQLQRMIQDEIDQLRETAKVRNLTVTFDKPATFPDVMLDETKTRQVIMNFIDNAIYYTPSGGQITVTLSETPASIEMRVKDNGIGVPKQEQQHLFTKFYRAGNARRARPDGTGLGLFMAKKIIVAQGGAILFDSKEGKGSTFGFILPKSKLQIPKA